MLKKIFKYEWRTITPLLLAIHAVGLAVVILCRIGVELMGGVRRDSPSIMACLLLTAAIIAVGCVALYTQYYMGYRFYKSVFAQQGYLTNTLPVTADQLIWGKGLTGVVWSMLSFLWCIAAILILLCYPQELGRAIYESFRAAGSLFTSGTPAFIRIIALSVLMSPFLMMIQMYVSAAVGNLFTGHKVLASVAVYLGIYFLEQIAALLLLVIAAPQLASLENGGLQIQMNVEEGFTWSIDAVGVYNTINAAMAFDMLLSVACAVAFYLLCRYVLKYRMNLE